MDLLASTLRVAEQFRLPGGAWAWIVRIERGQHTGRWYVLISDVPIVQPWWQSGPHWSHSDAFSALGHALDALGLRVMS